MKIQTFSILCGSEACNARCPFCISKMTPPFGVTLQEPEVNWRNFEIACRFAQQSGATTVMLTGKGEPTLFPEQITKYLVALKKFSFPFIEMQTNGIMMAEKSDIYLSHLRDWYNLGMTTIALSIVHYDAEKNREVYLPYKKSYIDLPKLTEFLRAYFSLRFTCILANGFIDSREKLRELIAFTKENHVGQLTLTPVNKPEAGENQTVWDWTHAHHLTKEQLNDITEYVRVRGTKLMHLAHGAEVFDVEGQNVCLNNCLSIQPESEEMRNLIFFPNEDIRYYWQYSGALLLQGWEDKKGEKP
jgi:molybdenum cofactor biosynthesis enzyme MoaA